jgi:RNA polymerase sigma factor (TIGR02999 family)
MDRIPSQRPATVDGSIDSDRLFDVLYAELHRLARRELKGQRPSDGLGVTTLLHEAYLKIAGSEGAAFTDRARFMTYAARVMRGLIIDDVRRRQSQKRGGLFHITWLRTNHGDELADPRTLSKIGDVLDELVEVEPELAEIIELKFFCGLSFAEIAAMRGVSERTIQRSWEKGRLYLHHAISDERPSPKRPRAASQP